MVAFLLLSLFLAFASSQWAVTASSVEALKGSLDGISPAVESPPGVTFYLSPLSCLGPNGVVSYFGPLGPLGPLGDNTWSASRIISGWFSWDALSRQLTDEGGPLSEDGPLGPSGPLGSSYDSVLPEINDFSNQLRAGGVWAVLGPLGPLGALGALGPLGSVGAHGYKADGSGVFRDRSGAEVRNVAVAWEGSKRVYPLVETYTLAGARKVQLDTSFAVFGSVSPGSSEAFSFTSDSNQILTAVVVPADESADFTLHVENTDGSLLAESCSDGHLGAFGPEGLVDFVHMPVKKNQKMVVRVRAKKDTFNLRWVKKFRLYVVGSTQYFPPSKVDISGPHQVPLGTKFCSRS